MLLLKWISLDFIFFTFSFAFYSSGYYFPPPLHLVDPIFGSINVFPSNSQNIEKSLEVGMDLYCSKFTLFSFSKKKDGLFILKNIFRVQNQTVLVKFQLGLQLKYIQVLCLKSNQAFVKRRQLTPEITSVWIYVALPRCDSLILEYQN